MIEDINSLLHNPNFYLDIIHYLWVSWAIWLPILLLALGINTWIAYKQREWIKAQDKVLLEIKLPKEILRSPQAMELVLEALWEPSSGNLGDAYGKGRVREWFSFELVSLGGEVKFFIWAFKKWKKNAEARIYAQYPGVEIFEVEDYARDVIFDPEKFNLWGAFTQLTKADSYPIKTYVDYDLEKGVEEQEEIVDPIVPLIEFLGSLKEGEQAWVQILARANRKEGLLDRRILVRPDWKGGGKEEIKKIIDKEAYVKPGADKPQTLQHLTSTQGDTIKSIERNLGKPGFEAMIRAVYFAPKDIYDAGRIGGVLGSFRAFSSQNLNGIKPGWSTNIDYSWQDFTGKRKIKKQKFILDAYKRRSFFYGPYRFAEGKPYILTTEEVATIYHFPGSVSTTPTLNRVPSKKAEAPSNLPL